MVNWRMKRRVAMPRSFLMSLVLSLVLLVPCAAWGTDEPLVRFTLLYTSDTHGHVLSSKDTVGLDWVAGVKQALEPSLLLDSGDFSDGVPRAVLDKGESMVRLMTKAGYFAAALGNHEFTYGRKILDQRVAQAAAGGMSVLSANVVKADGTPLVPASARTTVAGLNICVYGLTTQDTRTQAMPSSVADLTFLDPVAASRDMVSSLRASGCEIVIALAHIGNDVHVALKSTAIAEATPGLDILLDGHAHIELEERTASGTLVVSPGALGKKLGRLDVSYDRTLGKITSMRNTLLSPQDLASFAPDAALTADIAALDKKTDAELAGPVGESLYDLDGSRSAIRTRETNLGKLAADCLRAAHGTDFALFNAGSIRNSIKKGTVTGKDVLAMLPFTNSIVSFQITGAELLALLEHGLRSLPGEDGGFPQVSGMIVRIRADAPQGQRVEQLLLSDGRPVEKEKVYTLAVSSFLAEGGDGYALLAGKPRYKEYSSPQQALENYLQLVGTKQYAPGTATRLIFLR